MPSALHADLVYSDMSYCTLCDRYFPGDNARADHVQFAENHPRCVKCDKRFANGNSLRNHYVTSSSHHYCAVCEIHFDTARGFDIHIEFAAIHRDDSDDEDEFEEDIEFEDGWEDALAARMYPDASQDDSTVASDDESISDEELADYWTEDEETEFEEEQEAYRGFATMTQIAPNPAHAMHAQYTRSRSGSAGSDGSVGQISNVATGSVSDDDFGDADVEDDSDVPYSDTPAFAPSSEVDIEMGDDGLVPDQTPAPPVVRSSAVLFSCPLCLEAPKDTSVTRCGHVFCTDCILTALEQKRECPVCRVRAGARQLRKIFLFAN